MVSYSLTYFYMLLFHSVSTFHPYMFCCSSLVLVFLCVVLLLIAMSCHCPVSVCVRLSHSIKDYILTYLCILYGRTCLFTVLVIYSLGGVVTFLKVKKHNFVSDTHSLLRSRALYLVHKQNVVAQRSLFSVIAVIK